MARGQRLVVVQRAMHGDDEPCAAKGVENVAYEHQQGQDLCGLRCHRDKAVCPHKKSNACVNSLHLLNGNLKAKWSPSWE